MTALTHLSMVLISLLAAPQDEPQTQPEAKPQINIQQPGAQPVRPARNIESIKEYREGRDGCPYIRSFDDVRRLDLSDVDYDAEVLAKVNGKDITRAEFQLWYAMNAAQNGILRSQLIILTDKAIERAIIDGADPADFEVADEDIEAKLREEEDQIRSQGEEALTTYKTRIETTMGWEKYREYLRAHLKNERLLLPPIKAAEEGEEFIGTGLPLESAELLSGEKDKDLRNYLNDSYLTGKPIPPMFRTQFLRMLQMKMIDRADIKYALEQEPKQEQEEGQEQGLPEGVYMTVEGEPVTVEEVLEFVPPHMEVRDGALRVCLLFHAIDDALGDNDAILPTEVFEAKFREHQAEYENTLFPLPNLIGLRGFFNMSEYRQYYRRRVAFEKMMEPVVTDDDLRQHLNSYCRLFYESGKVNNEIFWVSLVDVEKQTGLEGEAAWEAARERIMKVKEAVLKGEMTPDAIRAEFCSEDKAFPRGNTGPKMRNEMKQTFSENDYLCFIHGYSLADDIFYNRVEGDLVGPVRIDMAILPGMRETLGYMLVMPTEYTKTSPLKTFENQKLLVVSDYYDVRFAFFAHECLKNAEIELTRKAAPEEETEDEG